MNNVPDLQVITGIDGMIAMNPCNPFDSLICDNLNPKRFIQLVPVM